jgi:hypothetical protein
MKVTKQFLVLLFIGALTSLQFATFFDDPSHLSEPDPDCPLCLAAQSPLYISQDVNITFTADIILYLVTDTSFDLYISNHASIFSIRAPPPVFTA